MAIELRPERPGDEEAIRRLSVEAFGQPQEARLVDALRSGGGVTLSLVAVDGDELVGHILFSPVRVVGDGGSWPAVGLAPMAVRPDRQRTGIGSQLVREGLSRLRADGHEVVVVLGHPDYYPRFGFRRASEHAIRWVHDAPDEAFLVLALVSGALDGRSGVVHYRPELDEV